MINYRYSVPTNARASEKISSHHIFTATNHQLLGSTFVFGNITYNFIHYSRPALNGIQFLHINGEPSLRRGRPEMMIKRWHTCHRHWRKGQVFVKRLLMCFLEVGLILLQASKK